MRADAAVCGGEEKGRCWRKIEIIDRTNTRLRSQDLDFKVLDGLKIGDDQSNI
ncbi:hypothetical protein ZOSMA_207G00220 [Zostera marina]|uniref:Uncharacterized protein n=1 Tax=Zostera marina TaxID=29655 RepID=A0A0K9PNH5_ZOSMR|nr:hypothetical protein ZOSMA_207G00220 [Zostera marina]